MFPRATAIGGSICAALLLVAAASGCNRPADQVEPTPAPFEAQVPGALGPPLIDPAPSNPTDPSVPPAPDPRGPGLPRQLDSPELPATEPVPTDAASTG